MFLHKLAFDISNAATSYATHWQLFSKKTSNLSTDENSKMFTKNKSSNVDILREAENLNK